MKAVILAGGKGKRLAPYTKILPKPLLPIGDMPILEVILKQLKRAGVDEAILTVGHLANLLRTYFNTGEDLGIHISYSQENTPLGTAGPLSLISQQLTNTFFVTNGDVLTDLDLNAMLAYHKEKGGIATIAMYRRKERIELGVIQCVEGTNKLHDYIEKPSYEFNVSMGLYLFEPEVLNYIPYNQYLDFPDLILKMLGEKEAIYGYPFTGYWEDLGRPDDYEKAINDFETLRPRILGE